MNMFNKDIFFKNKKMLFTIVALSSLLNCRFCFANVDLINRTAIFVETGLVTPTVLDEFENPDLSHQEMTELLNIYNPVFYFDSDQSIKPTNVDDVLNNLNLSQRSRLCLDGQWRLHYANARASFTTGKWYGYGSAEYHSAKSLGFIGKTQQGYDLIYYLYYDYNIANPVLNAWDHFGDWEGVKISLVREGHELKPYRMTTEAHGNQWSVDYYGGEVWFENGHPVVFIAEGSQGTYPNTNHERGIFDHPGPNSFNRTCVDGHSSAMCDFISRDVRHQFSIIPIKASNTSNGLVFTYLDNRLGQEVPYLMANTACTQEGRGITANGPIYRWGNKHNVKGAYDSSGPEGPRYKKVFSAIKEN